MPVVGTYEGYIVPEDVTKLGDIKNAWVANLKDARARIYSHLVSKIPDNDAFQAKIVLPAVAEYTNYVNPDYPKATRALIKFRAKLGRAFNDWKSAVDSAFAEGGTFESNVELKKDKILNVKYTIGAVGQKAVVGYNALAKAVMLITGDARLPSYIEGIKGDSLSGTPLNIFKPIVGRFVIPMLIPKGIAIAVYAYYFHESGDSTNRDNMLTDFNNYTSTVITAFKDTGKSGSLTMSWDTTRNAIKITSQASTT